MTRLSINKLWWVAFSLIVVALIMGCGWMARFLYHEQNTSPIIKERIVYIDRWHEPIVVETIRYEPLPDEYIDVAIRGLEQAIYSHQHYIDKEDISEGSFAWHQRTIDKYKIAITALESLKER